MKKTKWEIIVRGMVQGIGYRPFVAEAAVKYGIGGNVVNAAGVVIITAECDERRLRAFCRYLETTWPEGAVVESVSFDPIGDEEVSSEPDHSAEGAAKSDESFVIAESLDDFDSGRIPEIPCDLPTCSRCEAELKDPGNRRYRYPFISCTACGPRYTIIDRLPYDRCNTAMDMFPMCGHCNEEYTELGGVRRHAQTISCHDCGPQLHFTGEGREADGEDAFSQAVSVLKRGGIVAVKDIGGFHLACDPKDEAAVEELRRIKGREKKPFALMFRSLESVRKCCEMNVHEETLMLSTARPIVLLRKTKGAEDRMSAGVCGLSQYVGAMVPCAPLQIMLAEENEILIMTSANASGQRIITDNRQMQEWMDSANCRVPWGVLWHERDIRTPLDDSIVRSVCGRTQMFRRSRGYVPMSVPLSIGDGHHLFAGGGDLKSAFCFASDGRAWLSQYMGDLEEETSAELYRSQYVRMKELFGFRPESYAADMHPGYHSAKIVEEIAGGSAGNVIGIQHHQAHVASVIAEHGLKGKVIGIAFDGTGYGLDGNVWGSEFFLCEGGSFRRVAHLKPNRLIGGTEGAKNAETIRSGIMSDQTSDKLVMAAIAHGINTVVSTSMGRLFDGASALIGACRYSDYEGEAAIELENLAALADREAAVKLLMKIGDNGDGELEGDGRQLLLDVKAALDKGAGQAETALGFHMAIAGFVEDICLRVRAKDAEAVTIALSGGTFQNRILLEEVIRRLESHGFRVYINEKVPAGDGGICLGQAYIACVNANNDMNEETKCV